mmetsp:Transcript_638/g.1187  ORF Transcript_638/g.1187 Transcript_638/m.1187 type:complete len:1205 (+) Transcript_638:40-3654(+)
MSFFDDDNVAGRTLVQIASRGNAIIAELLRLSDNVPGVFDPAKDEERDNVHFKPVLLDFSFLNPKNQEKIENALSRDKDLSLLDEEFKETHLEILDRFYRLFDSMYQYWVDVNQFFVDLKNEVYIEFTVEGLLRDRTGKQLVAEVVYLFGVMLLLLDERMDGISRERILTAYFRYRGHFAEDNLVHVLRLCRATKRPKDPNERIPVGYPNEYLTRFALPQDIIGLIIGTLSNDDVYNKLAHYPLPEHRSVALAEQAAMLYVILLLEKDTATLSKGDTKMRELVDRHFPDNWVLPYYMGYVVDLTQQWTNFKAAKKALKNVVDKRQVQLTRDAHSVNVVKYRAELKEHLLEGVMDEQYAVEKTPQLLALMRNCHAALRWLVLHMASTDRDLLVLVCPPGTEDQVKEGVMHLLVDMAQLRVRLKNLLQKLVSERETQWQEDQQMASDSMQDLSLYFSGSHQLGRGQKSDEQLEQYFAKMKTRVDDLDFTKDPTLVGRKIQGLIQALQEVEAYHQVASSKKMCYFLDDVRTTLRNMIRTVNVRADSLDTLSAVGELSYAWQLIDQYRGLMQTHIQNNPRRVLRLRSLFLTLVSVLEIPLSRIYQAQSPDLESVSQYYSDKLVTFVRSVLQVIPINIFHKLSSIAKIQTEELPSIPNKVARKSLQDLECGAERMKVAKLSHQISLFMKGILEMDTTYMGVSLVDPQDVLKDGIRKEVVNKIVNILYGVLVFNSNPSHIEFELALTRVQSEMRGFRLSFEYIQDYIDIPALQMFYSEFDRIVAFNLEQDENLYLTKKILSQESKHQDPLCPIPLGNQKYSGGTFLGRSVRALRELSHPRSAIFALGGWWDASGNELVGVSTFSKLRGALGVAGLAGCCALLGFEVVKKLQSVFTLISDFMGGVNAGNDGMVGFFNRVLEQIAPSFSLPGQQGGGRGESAVGKVLQAAIQRVEPITGRILELLCEIGQLQLLRQHMAGELTFAAKLESARLFDHLSTLDRALANTSKDDTVDPEMLHSQPAKKLLKDTSRFLHGMGFENALARVYLTLPLNSSHTINHVETVLLFAVLSPMCLDRLSYSDEFQTLIQKRVKKEREMVLDGGPLAAGLVTVLQQMHHSRTHAFCALLGQHLRASIHGSVVLPSPDQAVNSAYGCMTVDGVFPQNAAVLLGLVDQISRLRGANFDAFAAVVPRYLLDTYRAVAGKSFAAPKS